MGTPVHGTVLDTSQSTTAADSVGVLGVHDDLGQQGLVLAGGSGRRWGREGRVWGEEEVASGRDLNVSC